MFYSVKSIWKWAKSALPRRDPLILVMGASGTGKSSFVNLASGSQFQVGKGLQSCTADIEISQPFDLDGRRVKLVDTPGFDDTSKNDADVLKLIADFLVKLPPGKVQGIVYLHRISDVRVDAVTKRNFAVFLELCGPDALQDVVIATTRWDELDESLGVKRENELKSKATLFKPAIDGGASLVRCQGTRDSAHAILRDLLRVERPPMELQIQREMVHEGKDISDTAAGLELRREILKLTEENERELRELQDEMEDATREEVPGLEREFQVLRDKLAQLDMEQKKLSEHPKPTSEGLRRFLPSLLCCKALRVLFDHQRKY